MTQENGMNEAFVFKLGDTVELARHLGDSGPRDWEGKGVDIGEIGTVVYVNGCRLGVDWDNESPGRHDCRAKARPRHGWSVYQYCCDPYHTITSAEKDLGVVSIIHNRLKNVYNRR